jgi:hypothetical protein
VLVRLDILITSHQTAFSFSEICLYTSPHSTIIKNAGTAASTAIPETTPLPAAPPVYPLTSFHPVADAAGVDEAATSCQLPEEAPGADDEAPASLQPALAAEPEAAATGLLGTGAAPLSAHWLLPPVGAAPLSAHGPSGPVLLLSVQPPGAFGFHGPPVAAGRSGTTALPDSSQPMGRPPTASGHSVYEKRCQYCRIIVEGSGGLTG